MGFLWACCCKFVHGVCVCFNEANKDEIFKLFVMVGILFLPVFVLFDVILVTFNELLLHLLFSI